MTETGKPRITITYCYECQWLLRAGWMAQEVLSTFAADLDAVTLVPATGGVFRIEYDGDLIRKLGGDRIFLDGLLSLWHPE